MSEKPRQHDTPSWRAWANGMAHKAKKEVTAYFPRKQLLHFSVAEYGSKIGEECTIIHLQRGYKQHASIFTKLITTIYV